MAHLTPPAARRNTAALIFFWASALFLIFALAAGGLVSCSSPAVDDLNLAYLDGTSGRLSDYRGQVVLLNFWATWCAPCREEMPALQAYYDDHRDQGFVLLAVNAGESADLARPYIEEYGYTFPVVLDRDGALFDYFAARGLPTSFVLDGQGRVRYQHAGILNRQVLEEQVTPLVAR